MVLFYERADGSPIVDLPNVGAKSKSQQQIQSFLGKVVEGYDKFIEAHEHS